MAQTQVSTGSALAIKHYSVALFAQAQRHRSMTHMMTGPAPKQADAERKLRAQSGKRDKVQTSREMPVVTVMDLSKNAGDRVSVDMFHTIGGKPIMGDRNAEGQGEKLSSASMEIVIDRARKTVDAGGKMTRKRTRHNLRGIALANLANWFGRYKDQLTMIHACGARGDQGGMDWVVPFMDDPDFAEILVNPVQAPTFNRHFVANGTELVQGGKQLEAIDSTDVLALEHIDDLSTLLSEAEYKLQPVKLPDDPAAEDEPLYVMMVSHRGWNTLQQKTTGNNWRTFLQNAWNRGSYGSKHPLFRGSAGMWGNILVRRMERCVRFNPGSAVNYVAQADRLTAAETATQVNAGLTAGWTVDRGLLLGGQAIAHVYGDASDENGSNTNLESYAAFKERKYDWESASEYMGEIMNGCAKLRFEHIDEFGQREKTDHGVMILDFASKPVSTVTAV